MKDGAGVVLIKLHLLHFSSGKGRREINKNRNGKKPLTTDKKAIVIDNAQLTPVTPCRKAEATIQERKKPHLNRIMETSWVMATRVNKNCQCHFLKEYTHFQPSKKKFPCSPCIPKLHALLNHLLQQPACPAPDRMLGFMNTVLISGVCFHMCPAHTDILFIPIASKGLK